jgi:hypothetical protein
MNEKINNEQEMGNNDKEKLEETSKKINIKPNETKNTNNNIDSSCNSKIKSNSVVVSVKQFVENDNDLDEVTVSAF